MKKYILFSAVMLTFLSCKTDNNKYVLNGSIDNVDDGKLVFLKGIKNNRPIDLDTTKLANGKFTFSGSVENPDMHILSVQNVRGGLPFILENKKIDFVLYKDSLNLSKISGSEANDIAQRFVKSSNVIKKERDELRKQYMEAKKNNDTAFLKSYNKKAQEINNKSRQFNIDFIEKNNTSIFSVILLENMYYSNQIPINKVKEIYESYPKDFQESSAGIRIKDKMTATHATAIGSVAPDFTAPSPDNKEITLSKIRGKVTIIDFWAAWCMPCRKENPNIVKIYNKYHDKGLEIIGVSLDGTKRQKDAKQDWINAIEKDGLTWYQVSNLNYFSDPIAKKYNIRSIPATFILDSEGKIISKNLRGPALEKKIAELLN